jgi:hypothetical protein
VWKGTRSRISAWKYWEIIADNLSKAGWSWGCVATVGFNARTIFVADAHRGDGKRFVVRADEKLTAFIELASPSAPSAPSLQQFGITNPLPDPRLEFRNANAALLASNDNWQSDASEVALITSYELAPPNNLESAIAISLSPGTSTAIVTGKNNQTGIGLIEIYGEH